MCAHTHAHTHTHTHTQKHEYQHDSKQTNMSPTRFHPNQHGVDACWFAFTCVDSRLLE